MSGHSKWHSIRHKKAAVDAKRGKLFTKLIKEITVAARLGGGDPNANPRLRTAIEAAQDANMPKENIIRAIKRGTGELEGVSYEEAVYEGYGPGGTAILVNVLTDNKNRTTAEVRHLFTKFGGSLGDSGCVSWMFNKRGLIQIPKSAVDEDTIFEIAIDAGAEDVNMDDEEFYEIYTSPGDLIDIKNKIAEKGIKIENAEVTMIPQNTVHLEGEDAKKLLNLINALEDHDDVQNVYSNFDIPDEIINQNMG